VIDIIKRLIGKDSGDTDAGGDARAGGSPVHDVHLATCAIFLEMAHVDGEFKEDEREHIVRMFEDEYKLPREEVLELKKASLAEMRESIDLWKFTNTINQHYNDEEKLRIAELLWRLVYADGKVDEYEDYLIRRLARLLRLTHGQLIEAKLRVTGSK